MNLHAILFITFLVPKIGKSDEELTNEINYSGPQESDENHVFELTQSVNLARQEYMQKACDNFNQNISIMDMKSENFDHLLVDQKHKLLYCYVPKVACTNWKRIMMIMAGKWNNTDVLSIPGTQVHSVGMFPTLGNFTQEERTDIINNYNKLIFVRHPFERLLSAFRNKLEDKSAKTNYFQRRVGRYIIKNFRPDATNASLLSGEDVTFKEFVEFLTSPSMGPKDMPYTINEHWETIQNLCHPCAFKYTIIGKYETLLDDAILALHTLNVTHIPFPRDTKTSGTADKLKAYFRPLHLTLIKKLYNIYKLDFKLFNYNLEPILGFDLG